MYVQYSKYCRTFTESVIIILAGFISPPLTPRHGLICYIYAVTLW